MRKGSGFSARISLAAVAAAALVMASATPVLAGDGRTTGRGGISTGEVIAGAVVLGGLAAIIGTASNRQDRRFAGGPVAGFSGPDAARFAIDRCVRAAEGNARRITGQRADVFEIRDVDSRRSGFRVKGRIAVSDALPGRGRAGQFRRGFRNNGWNEGRFTCEVRNGRVFNLNYHGIRGL